MARNDGVDRTTVRNQPRTESNIADAEAHNERQKACYRNEDIVPERSHLNIHFKEPSGSYQEMFRQMEQDGTISTRGLKQEAVHYGELVSMSTPRISTITAATSLHRRSTPRHTGLPSILSAASSTFSPPSCMPTSATRA